MVRHRRELAVVNTYCREHLLRHTPRSPGHDRTPLHRARQPRAAHRNELSLVAQTHPPEVITRKRITTAVSRILEHLREGGGLQGKDVANIVAVSPATVSRWSSGKATPDLRTQ